MVKAIVFDIGGVLIGLDVKACVRAFQENLGFARITQLLDPCHQKGIYGELEEGTLAPEAFREAILAESRPGTTPEQVDQAMYALLKGMDPDTVATVRRLRGKYPLYLLSNNNPISMPRCRAILAENGLLDAFQGEFVSCEMKVLKPAKAFYDKAAQGIGLPPQEILFIDDSPANVEGAKAAGWQARHLEKGMKLSSLLADL